MTACRAAGIIPTPVTLCNGPMKSDISASPQRAHPPDLALPELRQLGQRLGLPPAAQWTVLSAHRGRSVWRVDCGEDHCVVRVFRPGDGHGAAHEQKAMILARTAGLPVPRVRTTASFGERSLLLIDWCEGRSLQEELCSRPWTARRLGRLFGEQQAMLHEARAEPFCAQDWIGFFGEVDQAMQDRLAQAKGTPCLIHLDYYPANVQVRHGAVSGILDWTNARFGDCRADLARTWTLLNLVFRTGRRHPVRRWAESRFARGWREGYLRRAGPQADMPLFLAWAVEGLVRVARANEVEADVRVLTEMAGACRARAGLPPSPLQDQPLAG